MTRLQAEAPALILASGSATRLALLRAAGLACTVRVPGVDEASVKQAARAEGAAPDDAAVLLADLKAASVARSAPDALVIGADQILVCGEEWFDKPRDRTAAGEQLRALRGRPHRLVTAVVCRRGGGRVWQHVETPRLVMRAFSDAFVDAYLDAEEDSLTTTVGGYRVEGLGVQLFVSIDGEHAAILGLPLLPLLDFLRQHGVLTE